MTLAARSRSLARLVLLTLVGAACCGGLTLAGGSAERAVLVVDPTHPDALWAANEYARRRGIPPQNLIHMRPGAANFADFAAVNLPALTGELRARGIAEQIDYVIVMPTDDWYVPAPGYLSDGCASVNRIAIGGAYTLAFSAQDVLNGTNGSQFDNRYGASNNVALAFDSETPWFAGSPSLDAASRRYYIGGMLGYTGERGNTMPELLAMIDRGVASDGSFAAGTFYYMHTTDVARSSPRHGAYPNMVNVFATLGGNAVEVFADLPLGNHDLLGVMTGLANPDIDGADFTILPGAFCDHLTSFAGRFDTASQTKMSRWIAKGATATSGAVEEPCNYPGKFPHARMHVFLYKGLSMGEAWLRSMGFTPFQNLFYGDALARPFAYLPAVDLPDAPTATVTGSVLVHPTAVATAPGADVATIEVLVDGVPYRQVAPGDSVALHTAALADGWHDLRVLAEDDTEVRSVGRWLGSFVVANLGRSASVTTAVSAPDQGTAVDFTLSAAGAPTELRLVQGGRVLAATTTSGGSVRVFGRTLGAGEARVQCEALYPDGTRVRSAPLAVPVLETGVGAGGQAPIAYGYERELVPELAQIVALPAAFEDALDAASFTIVQPPAQAAVAPGAQGGYVVLTPNAGVTGVDSLVFRVTTPSGVSADATVILRYADPSCPQPTNYCVSQPNSSGTSAVMSWSGSTRLLDDDFTVRVFGAKPNQFGIFFYGPGQAQTPLGDGFLCVAGGGSGIFRLQPAVQSGFFGESERRVEFTQAPVLIGPGQIEPGSTWNFQFWYRDTGSASGLNLSDALAVPFCP